MEVIPSPGDRGVFPAGFCRPLNSVALFNGGPRGKVGVGIVIPTLTFETTARKYHKGV